MKYAIVESGGKQFRAEEGGTIEVDRLQVEAGTSLKLEKVLLLADGEDISVGTPLIKDLPIWTKVLAHFKGPKVTTFHYSPKKRIRVKTGHRQNYTRLLVEQIGGATLVKKEPVKKEEKALEKPAAEKAAKPRAAKAKKPATTAKKAETKAVKTTKPASKTPVKAAAKKAPAKKTTTKAAAEKGSSPKAKATPKKVSTSKAKTTAKKISTSKVKTSSKKPTAKK